MTTWTILLTVGATFRVTRFLVADAFPPVDALRAWIERHFGDESALAYLAYCPWCVSIYVGFALTYAVNAFHGMPVPVLVALSASAVTGLVSTHLDPPE